MLATPARPLRPLLALALAAFAAAGSGCGDDGGAEDGGAGANATGAAGVGGSGAAGLGGQATAGNGSGGAGAGGEGAAGGQGPALCQLTCGAPADCVTTADVPYLDADNYACDGGLCAWTGCLSDGECQALVPTYVCRDFFGIPNCFQGCTQPADCALPIQSQDADNWECVNGGCKTKGCLSDAECQADYGGAYRCRETGVTVAFCVETCTGPADCATQGGPAFDADNYACTDSFCDYLGCESNDACQASLGGAYVCQ